MSLSHGLLGLLNYSNMTGYELANTFNDSLSFFWQAQISQIYRELNRMEEQGLLSSHLEYQSEKPNKRVYSITEAGKQELLAWVNAKMPEQMLPTRSPILLRIFFSSLRPAEDNINALKQLSEIYQKQLDDLMVTKETMAAYSPYTQTEEDVLYWDMTADFGYAYTEMCLAWIKRCISRLEKIKQ